MRTYFSLKRLYHMPVGHDAVLQDFIPVYKQFLETSVLVQYNYIAY